MYTKKIWEKDLITGETKGRLVFIPDKNPNEFRRGWVASNQDALEAIANMNLSKEAYRVFFMLSSRIDFENWINISQKELADRIGMRKQHFSRALRNLVDYELILKGPKVGRNCTYRLNPSVGWKGKAKSHKYAIKEAYNRGFKVFDGIGGALDEEYADEFVHEMKENEEKYDPSNHPFLKEMDQKMKKLEKKEEWHQIDIEEAIEKAKKNLDKE